MASLFYFVFLFIWSFLFSSSHFSCAVVVVFYLFFYPGTLNTHTLTGWRTCGFCLRRRYLVRRGVNIATLPPSSDGGILMVLPPLFFLFTQKTRLRFVRFKFDPIFQPVDVVVVLSCCLFHDLFLHRCEVTMSHRNGRPHNNILNKDDETEMKWREFDALKRKEPSTSITHFSSPPIFICTFLLFDIGWVTLEFACLCRVGGWQTFLAHFFLSFFFFCFYNLAWLWVSLISFAIPSLLLSRSARLAVDYTMARHKVCAN